MTDQERIAALETRVLELEVRMGARVEAALEACAAVSGVAGDVLALIALLDRELVENLLRLRRLAHQANGSGDVSAEVLKLYQLALDNADQLAIARPLGPQ